MKAPLRILIVDDDTTFSRVMSDFIRRMLLAHPHSQITIVHTFSEAMEKASEFPTPDITFLDLVLPPMTMQETLAKIESLEDKTPVVIVTGYPLDMVRNHMKDGGRDTPILEKLTMFSEGGKLLEAAIEKAVAYFRKRKWAQHREEMQLLKEGVENRAAQK